MVLVSNLDRFSLFRLFGGDLVWLEITGVCGCFSKRSSLGISGRIAFVLLKIGIRTLPGSEARLRRIARLRTIYLPARQVHLMLTPQQLDEFRRLGIVRAPGAISPRSAAAMCDSVWDMMSRRYKVRRDDPATWKTQRIAGTKDRPKAITLEQVLNPLRAILNQLLAPAEWECDAHWGSLLVSFPGAFPEAPHGWEVPTSWHFDAPVVRALPELYGVRIFTCLADLPPQGGATLAVAGSPRLTQALAKARGMAKLRSAEIRKGLMQRYDWINKLCTFDPAIDRADRFIKTAARLEDVEVRVVEMTGEPGDVHLVHPLMMHAASPNCLAMPRIVLSSTVYQRGVDWSVLYGPEGEAAV